jgi:hypothetical protein
MIRHPKGRHQYNLTVERLIELLSTVDPKAVVCCRTPDGKDHWPIAEEEIWVDTEDGIIVVGD